MSESQKQAETPRIEPETTNEAAPMLFEMSQFEKPAIEKRRSEKKKVYTIEIEQPSLF